jgi:hypothetical protein
VVEFPRGTDSADALRLGAAAISALKKMGYPDAEAHHFDTEGILWMEFPNLPAELRQSHGTLRQSRHERHWTSAQLIDRAEIQQHRAIK